MILKNSPFVAVALAAALSFAGMTGVAEAKTTIKVGTQAPKGTAWMKAMADIAKKVKKKTKGKVVFKFFPNGTLGDEKVVINRMKTYEIDGGLFTGIGLGQIESKVRILELPFIYKVGTKEHDTIRDMLEQDIIQAFDRKGYVFLGWGEVGWAYLFSKVETPDLDGLRQRKPWYWQDDPLAQAAYGTFGLKGVPLALTDVLPSLNSGMIDTVYNSPYGLIGLQWHTKIKYMSRINVGHGTGALLISKRIFKKIPKKYRKDVLDICRKRCKKLVKEIAEENKKAEEQLKQQGVKFLPIAKKDVPTFEKLGKDLAKKMVGKLYSQELLDKVTKKLAEIRKKEAADGKSGG